MLYHGHLLLWPSKSVNTSNMSVLFVFEIVYSVAYYTSFAVVTHGCMIPILLTGNRDICLHSMRSRRHDWDEQLHKGSVCV